MESTVLPLRSTVYADVERFLPTVGMMRLRGVVAKYPKFEAEASG